MIGSLPWLQDVEVTDEGTNMSSEQVNVGVRTGGSHRWCQCCVHADDGRTGQRPRLPSVNAKMRILECLHVKLYLYLHQLRCPIHFPAPLFLCTFF